MREVIRSVLIARPAALVYELINDIERYPEFVPGCASARVISREPNEIVALLGIKKGPLALEFTTRNRLTPSSAIAMQLLDGPFTELTGGWRLTALSGNGCRATLSLRFAFSNRVTALVLEPLFEKIVADLVEAFVLRARQLPASV
jgi:ribosome-associated toxin RatA of RatAB toxin-antitoxin module